MNTHQAIGIFDSGIGGLSVMFEMMSMLPYESMVYFCDNMNAPYGAKSPEEIKVRAFEITKFLLERHHVKSIVVACNTATAAAIRDLRKHFEIPFIGIEPGIKPAALQTKSGAVGVLATLGTLNGGHFNTTYSRFAKGIKVIIREGKGLVELVEQGLEHSPAARILLNRYLQPMVEENIDHLVLGCTHYPFLLEAIQQLLPSGVTIINPADAVARQLKNVLNENHLLAGKENKPEYLFYCTGYQQQLKKIVKEKLAGKQYSIAVPDMSDS